MSNVFFPAVDGTGKAIHLKVDGRSAQFTTQVQRGIGGSEFRVSRWVAPRWTWKVSHPVLPDSSLSDTLRTILAFFMERQGSADSFLWSPPEDAATAAGGLAGYGGRVTGVQIGVGDGVQKIFPLVRPFGATAYPYGKSCEPVPWVDSRNFSPAVRVNGVAGTWSLGTSNGAPGGATQIFASAPAVGAVIVADFEMAYRVRFGKDSMDLKAWAWQLWKGSPFDLEQVFE